MSLIIIICTIMEIWYWMTIVNSCVEKWLLLVNGNIKNMVHFK